MLVPSCERKKKIKEKQERNGREGFGLSQRLPQSWWLAIHHLAWLHPMLTTHIVLDVSLQEKDGRKAELFFRITQGAEQMG